MMIRCSLITLIVAVGFLSSALAQPSMQTSPEPVGSGPAGPGMAVTEQVQPAPAQAQAAEAEPVAAAPSRRSPLHRLSFGFHVLSGSFKGSDGSSTDADMTGYGAFLRYRHNRRWEVELDFGKSRAAMSSDRERRLRPIVVSALVHLLQFRQLDGYVRAGFGRANEVYETPRFSLDSTNNLLHVGAGLHLIVRGNIGIAVEARWFSLSRTDEARPLSGTGREMHLAGVYHF